MHESESEFLSISGNYYISMYSPAFTISPNRSFLQNIKLGKSLHALFPKSDWMHFEGPFLFPPYPIVREFICLYRRVNMVDKIGLTHLSNTWRISYRSSILRKCLVPFHRRYLACRATSTLDILVPSAICLPLFSKAFFVIPCVDFRDSQLCRRVDTAYESNRMKRRDHRERRRVGLFEGLLYLEDTPSGMHSTAQSSP